MSGKRVAAAALLAGGGLVFLWWGFALAQAKPLGGLDFRALYEGTACLLHGHDPFNPEEVRAYYAATGDAALYPGWALYTLSLLNYLPTVYLLVAPFALLPWATAQLLWTGLTAAVFLVALFLMWKEGDGKATLLSGALLAFLVANSEITLSGGNAAGLAVGLAVIGAWCFLHQRHSAIGVLCLAASLAMKPHDGGLVWLYFVLAGGRGRRQAWRTLGVCAALGIAAAVWAGEVAPHWIPELRAVMATYASHGGANDPGILGSPHTSFRQYGRAVYPGMVCDLESVVAVFRDDARFYNPVTYLFCAPFLLLWALRVTRSPPVRDSAYLALAAVVPFTLLVTYHRTTDTKLLMLTVPACASLWATGSLRGRIAVLLTGLGFFLTGDIPLVVMGSLVGNPDWLDAGLPERAAMLFLYRPVPLVLLALGMFYLWALVRSEAAKADGHPRA